MSADFHKAVIKHAKRKKSFWNSSETFGFLTLFLQKKVLSRRRHWSEASILKAKPSNQKRTISQIKINEAAWNKVCNHCHFFHKPLFIEPKLTKKLGAYAPSFFLFKVCFWRGFFRAPSFLIGIRLCCAGRFFGHRTRKIARVQPRPLKRDVRGCTRMLRQVCSMGFAIFLTSVKKISNGCLTDF